MCWHSNLFLSFALVILPDSGKVPPVSGRSIPSGIEAILIALTLLPDSLEYGFEIKHAFQRTSPLRGSCEDGVVYNADKSNSISECNRTNGY